MKRILVRFFAAICLLGPPTAGRGAEDPAGLAAEESAVRAASAAYLQAFNKHDAEAVAALWSPEAVYLNRISGEEVVGRKAIAEQFVKLFKAESDAKLAVEVDSVQFVSPNVAIERGTSTFAHPQGEPEQVAYSAVYVKRDGKWLLDRVTDQEKETPPPSNYEHLKTLEWMVGSWVDKADDVEVETTCNWTKNRNFLTRSFRVETEAGVELAGMQVIGWDPTAKTIRSWTFDSDGGFAAGVWTFKAGKWTVRNMGYLADGRKASMVNVVKPVDADSFTWRTVEQTAGGELLPNSDEILVVRK